MPAQQTITFDDKLG